MNPKLPWSTRRTLPGVLALLLVTALLPAGSADEVLPQNPKLKRFYSDLQTLFRKHYPEVTSHLVQDRIHLGHDTRVRVFIVHEPTMTGEWQDPWETRGPEPGGILCDLTLLKGPYQGQAVVPQTSDKRYFKVWLAAPETSRRDWHLAVHLSYPRDAGDDFLKQFMELINGFERYLD